MIKAREAAQRLGVSLPYFYRNYEAWNLPAYRIGGTIRFRANEVESFIDSLRV